MQACHDDKHTKIRIWVVIGRDGGRRVGIIKCNNKFMGIYNNV